MMPLKSDSLKIYDFASVTPLGIHYRHAHSIYPTDWKLFYLDTDSEELEECRIVVRESLL
jgi:hypothetical protein